ncbi:hypothetical protein PsorP6_015332 [Peronosclerospora sorghi]|uniref:Uncharacterized protein n=1 Tax=Peronosclerospora sorghi TaxID=230839 RepID=A0ACC0VSF5_9STRA|nr:hypothetical protein PsorP6_015332 [Peronosclerospora sorghi]
MTMDVRFRGRISISRQTTMMMTMLKTLSPLDTDVEMNEPMEEEHEPVTAVVTSGVPTTTATQHTPKPPVMSDTMDRGANCDWMNARTTPVTTASCPTTTHERVGVKVAVVQSPRVDDDDVLYEVALAAQDTPRTYKEAVTCDEKEQWLGAIDTEFEAH